MLMQIGLIIIFVGTRTHVATGAGVFVPPPKNHFPIKMWLAA